MNIFVLNCGSSSLKYKMIAMPDREEILGGEVQRIGSKTAEPSTLVHHDQAGKTIRRLAVDSYSEAFEEVMKIVMRHPSAPPEMFAHRMVQGGPDFPSNTVVRDGDFESLERTKELAPIHNPPVVELMEECRRKYPGIPQAIILDTAFHSTMPDYAFTYSIPKNVARELGIRKYGFHGISHRYVSREAARFLDIPSENFNAVSCHLGSGGASLCAIVGGKSVDNSMGFSPLQGLVMSTRCGDVDPAIILRMIVDYDGDYSLVDDILNRQSGVLALSGLSSDIRDIIRRAINTGDDRAQRTLDLYIWRIKKYLGSYLAVVGRPHAIIFTDTIGESVPYVREAVCRNMEFFGVRLDEWKNKTISVYPSEISSAESRVRIIVVKTNEELAIANEAFGLLGAEMPGQCVEKEGENLNEKADCLNP